MSPLAVAEIAGADVEAVVRLWRACGLVVPHNDPVADIAFARSSGHGTVLVGRLDGAIAATVMVGHEGHRGWLYYVAVDPTQRRRALGREIMAAAEQWLKDRGVPKVQLMIRETNRAVRGFYLSQGYHQEPRTVMARWLDGRPPAQPPLDVSITWLAMDAQPGGPRLPAPPLKLALLRAEQPTVAFYRFLYDTVGGPWLWYQRQLMRDEELAAIVQDPGVQVWVLYVGGVPAGYFELDGRQPGEVDLALFGLMPDFIGRKIGPWLLDQAIHAAWDLRPRRVTVNTCSLDHPKALALYQRAGFVAEKRTEKVIPDPRPLGSVPAPLSSSGSGSG